MTTSGTTTFGPSAADFIGLAFGRIQMRRPDLKPEHMTDAALEANLLQVEWANKQPNLWTAQTITQVLNPATVPATYTLNSNNVDYMIVTMTVTSGGSSSDRVLGPVSTTEYLSFPDKATPGVPSVFWLDRQTVPQITFWQPPDSTATYTVNMRFLNQLQDVVVAGGTGINAPYRWYDAFVAGLAARLAEIYPENLVKVKGPQAVDGMHMKAEKAWGIAAAEDHERVNLYITPGVDSYWR